MLRNVLTVSSGTLASRLLGFLRDAMVAALLGAGPIADALLVAFQMVNVVRRLLTEGALNAALVPAWLRVHGEQGAAAAAAFAGRVLGTISLGVFVAAALLGLAMPAVIALLAPGFVGTEALSLAVRDARLMLPYLAFAGPVAVMMALLNARRNFALTSFSPLLFNAALIAVMGVLLLRPVAPADAAWMIAATVGIAGLLQLATLFVSSRAIATPVRAAFDAPMRAFLARVAPGMVASSGPQLLIVAGAIAASREPAAVSWLYFANRLIELPLGLVGTALGTVLVPVLTRAQRSGDGASVIAAQSRGVELALGLALPAMLGLVVLAQPIVRLLFEHGAFTADDTVATARILVLLGLGLPAHVLTKALAPMFFAREDTMTPLIATLCGLGVTLIVSFAASSVTGIALAIAAGAWVSALILAMRAIRRSGLRFDIAARRNLPRIAGSALAMGAVLWLALPFAAPSQGTHMLAQAIMLGVLIAGGLLAYSALLVLTGVVPLAAIRRRLRG